LHSFSIVSRSGPEYGRDRGPIPRPSSSYPDEPGRCRACCKRYQIGLVSSPTFTFEQLTFDDLPFLIEVRNECREFLHDNRVFTLPECERWFRETKPDFRIIRHHGERIGYFRLTNYDPQDSSIYNGADLHKDFRGRGLARGAYEA